MRHRSARHVLACAGLLALTGFASAPAVREAPAAALSGVFVADRYNGGPVPATDRFPSAQGYSHYVKLEEGVVTMRPNGTFVSSWRYYHELLRDGQTVPRLQLKTDSYRGRYTQTGNNIVFRPEPSRRERNPRTVTGTIVGDRMRVTFPIDDAGIQRTLRMELKRDPNRF